MTERQLVSIDSAAESLDELEILEALASMAPDAPWVFRSPEEGHTAAVVVLISETGDEDRLFIDIVFRGRSTPIRTEVDLAPIGLGAAEGVAKTILSELGPMARIAAAPSELAEAIETLIGRIHRSLLNDNSRLRRELASANIRVAHLEALLTAASYASQEGHRTGRARWFRVGAAGLALFLGAARTPVGEAVVSGATEAVVGDQLSDDPGIDELLREACDLAGDEVNIDITVNQDNDVIDGGTP